MSEQMPTTQVNDSDDGNQGIEIWPKQNNRALEGLDQEIRELKKAFALGNFDVQDVPDQNKALQFWNDQRLSYLREMKTVPSAMTNDEVTTAEAEIQALNMILNAGSVSNLPPGSDIPEIAKTAAAPFNRRINYFLEIMCKDGLAENTDQYRKRISNARQNAPRKLDDEIYYLLQILFNQKTANDLSFNAGDIVALYPENQTEKRLLGLENITESRTQQIAVLELLLKIQNCQKTVNFITNQDNEQTLA